MYAVQLNGVLFECEEVEAGYEESAKCLADNYEAKLTKIAEFMLPDLTQIYGDMSSETLINALGMPLINLDRETLTYLEHTLDDEHIIELEFNGILEEFFYLSIDG